MTQDELSVATLGGGCFWCLEAVFSHVKGIETVASGFAGGALDDPTYEEVCSGASGHAEVCRIRFDPAALSYEDLLIIFFGSHDPTTVDRQGADVGPQYRSIILTHDEKQRATAEKLIAELDAASAFPRPIVTEIRPHDRFYPAEDHHQDYYARNPGAGYCAMVIRPKLDRFQQVFGARFGR